MSNPADLVFKGLPVGNPANLVFGEADGSGADVTATITGTMPALSMAVAAAYSSSTSRPVVGSYRGPHQSAAGVQTGRQSRHQDTTRLPAGVRAPTQAGALTRASTTVPLTGAVGSRSSTVSRHSEAVRSRQWSVGSRFQDGTRNQQSRGSRFQAGAPVVTRARSVFQDALRTSRASVRSGYVSAAALHQQILTHHTNAVLSRSLYRHRHQQAVPPNGGPYIPPPVVIPDPELCYTPNPHLLFSEAWSTDTGLLFFCENHLDPEVPPATVVVPIRSVYIVINDIQLRRVSNNLSLPTLNLSLSIDADSWTWGFSASLPATELDNVLPGNDGPVELEATINGNAYRLLAESVARERAFGSASIRVSGRGRNAVLSAPYAPVMSFANAQERTAQQLMADVLTVNGVPLGWDIDWGITDWLVPAGAFAGQGTYIDGVTAIASAAGAYIQPHPTAKTLRVLLRYPVAPWAWAGATPDFELPSSVMTRESVEWIDKPEYNRVFVSGTSQGVLAQVTRAGTAGALVAPLITDPLITATEVARQRGTAVLADTGRQATVRLSLPVLASTGVITPGKLVRYTDGATTRIGLVRAVGVEAGGGGADLRQTITLETHL